VIVTLLTDFGTGDYFVGAMKGVILSGHPGITITDISHEVPPHEIATAAFLLYAVYEDFPTGSVHTVVVDPGVGTDRLPIAVRADRYLFVAPDNGVLTYILDRNPSAEVRAIEDSRLIREAVAGTFHGRDVFAPAAAALAAGFPFESTGERVTDPVRLPGLRNEQGSDGSVIGSVLHIDRFGNCITSLTVDDLGGEPGRFVFRFEGGTVEEVRTVYGGAQPGSRFMIQGSTGFLELSIDRESAAAAMGVRRGQSVRAEPRAG
jgi:S-adenosyl-L-methionine hydrolase (adenosine-forming)